MIMKMELIDDVDDYLAFIIWYSIMITMAMILVVIMAMSLLDNLDDLDDDVAS